MEYCGLCTSNSVTVCRQSSRTCSRLSSQCIGPRVCYVLVHWIVVNVVPCVTLVELTITLTISTYDMTREQCIMYMFLAR